MSQPLNRRHFLTGLLGAASLPLLKNVKAAPSGQRPVLVCSRGEYWGRKVLQPAWDELNRTGHILNAVEKGANVAELDPEDASVGYGGLPNEDGVVQLDACIMDGATHNCGSVACMEDIKTPCSVARLVMERTDHIHLVGEGARRFAILHGFKPENLLTEYARKRWLEWKENLSDEDDWFPPKDGNYDLPDRPTGTINVLGVDASGNIAGVTTTSGLAWKISGRVGDSPIIGAGLYVDNEIGAAGATGRGEEVIRTCGSFFIVERMRAGDSPQQACEAACQRIIEINGGLDKVNFNDKFIAVNKNGKVGCASILKREEKEPSVSYWTNTGFHAITGAHFKTL